MNWMNGALSKSGCHTGNPVVFEVDGISVHAGGHTRDGGWHLMSPAPDVAMGPAQVMDGRNPTVVPKGFRCAEHIGSDIHFISMDWPDFDIPQDVGRQWWLTLVDDFKRLGIKTVSTQCVGGHGRTGVQLAILAHLMGAVVKPDAASIIKWVRASYCTHAVETYAQQVYVAECCDIPVGERLFAAPKKKSISFDDEPTPSTYWAEEEDTVDELKIPKDFRLLGCHECGDISWVHDDDKGDCKCGNPERVAALEVLYEVNQECSTCSESFTRLSITETGECKSCYIDDAKTNKDGNIQCKKCKRYYIPESINVDTCKCISCERKATLPKGKDKRKGKKKKNGNPKYPKIPKGGLEGETLKEYMDRLDEYSDDLNDYAQSLKRY